MGSEMCIRDRTCPPSHPLFSWARRVPWPDERRPHPARQVEGACTAGREGGERVGVSWAGEAWPRDGSRKKGLVNTRLRPFFHPPKRPGRFAARPRCRPPRSPDEVPLLPPAFRGQGAHRGPHAAVRPCPPSRRRSHRGPGRLGLGWQFLGGRPRERRAPAARSLGWVEIQPQPCVGQAGFPGPIPGPRFARPGIAIPIQPCRHRSHPNAWICEARPHLPL